MSWLWDEEGWMLKNSGPSPLLYLPPSPTAKFHWCLPLTTRLLIPLTPVPARSPGLWDHQLYPRKAGYILFSDSIFLLPQVPETRSGFPMILMKLSFQGPLYHMSFPKLGFFSPTVRESEQQGHTGGRCGRSIVAACLRITLYVPEWVLATHIWTTCFHEHLEHLPCESNMSADQEPG